MLIIREQAMAAPAYIYIARKFNSTTMYYRRSGNFHQFRRRPLQTKIKHMKYCTHSVYVYRPIPNISLGTKIINSRNILTVKMSRSTVSIL